ncbi:retinol dehydrogenase 11 [Pelomyxa schiedti]|nr:retinol dehydrogenase 11 [Pelomyxa schiedti]
MGFVVAIVGVVCACILVRGLRLYSAGGRCKASPALVLRGGATKGGDPRTADYGRKVAIVTGANTGIGRETAAKLGQLGAIVVLAVRDLRKGEEAVEDIQKRYKGIQGEFKVMKLDLSSLASVRNFAQDFLSNFHRCDLLINNAGVMLEPHGSTADGFEVHFGINHLGHFLLTALLLPTLRQSRARVVNVSSIANAYCHDLELDNIHPTSAAYDSARMYGRSKLANVLFTRELQRRFGKEISSYSLHPGVIRTSITRHLPRIIVILYFILGWLGMKSSEEGAQTTLHCALAEEGPLAHQLQPGLHYSDCRRSTKTSPLADDPLLAKKLWELSERLVGVSTS